MPPGWQQNIVCISTCTETHLIEQWLKCASQQIAQVLRRCIGSWANFLCIKSVLITQPFRSWKWWSGSSNCMVLTKGNFSPSLPRVLWIYSVTGEWVYPLFALFSPSGLAAFFAGSLAIIISCYNFGEFLNRMIWGQSKFSSLLLCIWKKYP